MHKQQQQLPLPLLRSPMPVAAVTTRILILVIIVFPSLVTPRSYHPIDSHDSRRTIAARNNEQQQEWNRDSSTMNGGVKTLRVALVPINNINAIDELDGITEMIRDLDHTGRDGAHSPFSLIPLPVNADEMIMVKGGGAELDLDDEELDRSSTTTTKYTAKRSDFKRNNKQRDATTTVDGKKAKDAAELFTKMRSICAKMPRLKRKRTPRPGSPESLVAFLCSSTNIF